MRAEYYRAQGQKCQRLASETLDVDVREALIELASDYERQAQRLARGAMGDKISSERMNGIFHFPLGLHRPDALGHRPAVACKSTPGPVSAWDPQ